MRHSRLMGSIAVVLSTLAMVGCSNATGNKNGSLSLKLTDAAGDFKKAVVTIDQIYLQSSEGSGKLVLRDADVTVDLLTLANATSDLVSETVIPAGRYTQLHFVISGGYIEVENADGSSSIYASSPTYSGLPAGSTVTGSLQMPSFALTGIKVNLPGGVVEIGGGQKILLVDFDVSRSFGKQAGQSSQWVMTPVLNATDFVVSASLAVSLSKASNVTLPSGVTVGGFKAVLANSAGSRKELSLADSNGDGTFDGTFSFVAPGDYTIDFKAPSGVSTFTTDPTRPSAVTLSSGQAASRAFVLTAANP